MPFLLLICLMAACLPLEWPVPIFGPSPALAGASALAIVLILVGSAALTADRAVVSLGRSPDSRGLIGRRYMLGRHLLFFANLFGFALLLLVLGWGWLIRTTITFVDSSGQARLLPGAELLVLSPFIFLLIGSWLVYYDSDRAFHESHSLGSVLDRPFWSRGGYIFYQLRQNVVLFLLPALLLTVQQGILRVFPQTLDSGWASIMSLGTVPAFFILLPLFLPGLLGLKPLPAGPLSDRLRANARRIGVGYRDILLWNTRGMAANAMVVGLVPRARYILFTDRLLEELSEDEVDGVLGHEIGHVKHFHMFLYLAVLALGASLFEGVSGAVRLVYSDWTKAHPDLFTALPITALGMYVFAIFGFLSRKCERQADIFGCKALSCENPHCDGHPSIAGTPFEGQLCPTGIRTFASALRRVAEMGGHSNEALKWQDYPLSQKPVWLFERLVTALNTWQHSTIEKRIRYLERLAAHPEEEVGFQRRLFAGKVALLFVLLAGISALGIEFGWSIFVGDGV